MSDNQVFETDTIAIRKNLVDKNKSGRAAIIFLWVLMFLNIIGCTRWLDFGRTSKRYSDLAVFSSHPVNDYPNYSVGRFKISFLAGQITRVLKVDNIRETPLIVLPVYESDGSEKTVSSFGWYFAEQLRTELYLNDFRVLYPGAKVEEKLLSHLAGNPEEFWADKDEPLVGKLSSAGVKSIIGGSYQIGDDKVYVNLQMILLESMEIISIGSCELKKEKNIMSLIEKREKIRQTGILKDQVAKETGELTTFTIKGKDDF